jgi:hypothetical protein
MNKDIQKLIDDSKDKKYSKLSDKQLSQFDDFVKKGANASIKSSKFLEVRSKGGKIQGKRNVKSGHLKSIASLGGKAGAKTQIEKGLGIHTDKETRKEWSRLGGLAVIDNLNRERQCPYCSIKTKGAAYNRWHGDNCRHKK